MLTHEPEKKLRVLGWGLHAAGLACVLLVALAGYMFVLRPVDYQIEEDEISADAMESGLARADALHAEQQDLTRRIAALVHDTGLVGQRVPEEPLEAEFLSQVAAAANQVGLKILDYRPGVASVQENCSKMEIQLSCSGPYRSLCGFLDRLNTLDRLSRITQAEIAAAGPEGCTIGLTLVVFFRLKNTSEASTQRVGSGVASHG